MITNIVKGFIIGIAKIIPGVSGSSIAMIFDVYEKSLNIVANIRHMTLRDFLFLLSLGLGIILGVCLFSSCVKWLLNNFYSPVMLLFTGLIFGGTKSLVSEVNSLANRKINSGIEKNDMFIKRITLVDVVVFIISLSLVFLLSNDFDLKFSAANFNNNFLTYFLLGLIESFSSIIPGISGTAIYMALGCYELMLDFFGNFFKFSNGFFLLFFSLGILCGVIVFSKLLVWLFNNYRKTTYIGILGFMIGSIIIMLIQTFTGQFSIIDVALGILLFEIGYKLVRIFDSLFANS